MFISAEKCSGCRTCELICAIEHFGVNNPKKAAIRVMQLFPDPAMNVPIVCRHCSLCIPMEKCPTNAICRLEDDRISIDREKCIGCMVCAESCPLGAVFSHHEIEFPIRCDLCSGNPLCIEFCPMGALEFVPKEEIGQKARAEFAIKAEDCLDDSY